jgi:hypothetical protein
MFNNQYSILNKKKLKMEEQILEVHIRLCLKRVL